MCLSKKETVWWGEGMPANFNAFFSMIKIKMGNQSVFVRVFKVNILQ
jgi:hypothetical protein